MDPRNIIQAWKNPEYRARLSPEQRASLPECPSGRPLTELGEEELGDIIGGRPAPIDVANTGCTGEPKQTCGIINCDIKILFPEVA
ncbi:mersacidin/lichenicidin family type 2 lantibiotic [Hyalangium rubrum]|uniref:Mersacidin/lichenicidin family type 2 lantibiotic n=1 Tax=Hyalangium rubrum TaxID=3103134 RepID=A0ABU5GYG4_9BACT|nr:mersacidin/lichenicidin family type 2 lantibiotic [Hyalangium sp. s54d21]MDY7226232.1 mersacidin/lichenicidin family type 2 lantibiotic [Hyalangium sp. s54d21]